MIISKESFNDEIENINNEQKKLNLLINKKEDDIKNIISEKEEIIQKMKNKINEQEIIIKESKKEISNLNQKIEKIFNNMSNELKNKEDKLKEMENKLATINKEKGEEINELKNQMKELRLEILNKVSNKFSILNKNELKNNYRIIIFGQTHSGKSQFCNFVIKDKTNSTFRVSDSLGSCNIEGFFQSKKFNRLGTQFELIDTEGFEDDADLQIYSKILKANNNIDYIILILDCNNRITFGFRKFVENLIKIFTAEKFYNHFCIVFTHSYYLRKKIEKRKKYIIGCNEIFKKLFNNINKQFDIKIYFVDTEFDEDENTFDEKSQDTIDIILNQIKFDVDCFGSIS